MAEEKKNYPSSTSEIARIFGMHETEHPAAAQSPEHEEHEVSVAPPSHLPVADLPVAKPDVDDQIAKDLAALKSQVKIPPVIHDHGAHGDHGGHGGGDEIEHDTTAGGNWKNIVKTILPYLVVFALGAFVFVFFFSNVNLNSLFKKSAPKVSVQDTALQQLEKQNLADYQKWISQFYYSVSDSKVLDPNGDNSGNGLSNFQKYLLNLNPKSYDTLGLGMADSESLARGINPLSGNPLTDEQKQVINKYFDMEVIMNKLALAKMKNSGQVAGAAVFSTQQTSGTTGSYSSFGNNGASSSTPVVTADPAGNILNANDLDMNMNVPGRLQISSLKTDAPIVWSKDPATFEQDLKSGVVHYPGTAVPGQIGTTYISGHSSNYAWVKGNYNHVFTYLGDLPDNASFSITVTLNNGKQVTLHYVVTGRKEYAPTDTAQFANSGKSVVALSTCWPVGSTAKRLVVFGELTQIDR